MDKKTIASMIDHTQLKATATLSDIKKLCAEARENSFASVCVNPVWVCAAANELAESDVKVCTVIGFPLGASAPAVKAYEARHAVMQGADEVDMVINVGEAKAKNFDAVQSDIKGVVEAAKDAGLVHNKNHICVKVIIETCYLTDEEKIEVCKAAKLAGADFVKTSTGFGTPGTASDGSKLPAGATVADVALMRKTVDEAEPKDFYMQVKASGGIRDTETALAMVEAGANRLGVSAGIAIVNGIN
ncbi:MAG: deoxyribose-phosphate aldolase [Treponemataceae bacterium]|nr:deoxyribose-phosphate aldolase [Treponemataceae bacterium]